MIRLMRLLKWSAWVAVAGIAALTAAVFGVDYPVERLTPEPTQSLRIEDARGELLRERLSPRGGRGRWVRLRDISPHLIDAVIAAEDKRFHDHAGIDPIAIARAAVGNLRHGRVTSGASTITQQLVRLVEPRPRTFASKLVEAVEALRLERALDKDAILEQYLNRAPFSNQVFGVEAAARQYFDKPADQLSLAEAAFLAGLPQAPTAYNPYRRFDRAKRRQLWVLGRMRELGMVDAETFAVASAEPIRLRPPSATFRAPHFTDWLVARLADGSLPAPVDGVLRTTLDVRLNEDIEGIVRAHLRTLGSTRPDAAVVVIRNHDGALLAMVGSPDWHDRNRAGQVNGALAPRSPGSALKPFAYARAFEDGMTPATVLADVPVHYGGVDGGWSPRNYDGKFHGPVRAREALAGSLNVPAVRVVEHIGAGRFWSDLRELGLRLPHGPDRYGLALALGGVEVNLLELTDAYAALARGGRWRRVVAVAGQTQIERAVFDPIAAHQVADVLADADARAVGFGRHGVFELPFAVSVKTGTGVDCSDNWAMGFTSQYTVGVWVGRFDGASLGPVAAVKGAGPIFRGTMLRLHEHIGGTRVTAEGGCATGTDPRSGTVRVEACALSGLRRGADCPTGVVERLRVGTEPAACDWHRRAAIDLRTGGEACGRCDARFVEHRVIARIPPEFRLDGESGELRHSALCCQGPATQEGTTAGPAIRHPVEGDRFVLDPARPAALQAIALRAASDGPVQWRIDGRAVGRSEPGSPLLWTPTTGDWEIVAVDARGRAGRAVRIQVR